VGTLSRIPGLCREDIWFAPRPVSSSHNSISRAIVATWFASNSSLRLGEALTTFMMKFASWKNYVPPLMLLQGLTEVDEPCNEYACGHSLRIRAFNPFHAPRILLPPLSYGPPWAHYLGGYQDRLLGGPLGLPGLRYTALEDVEHKDYTGVVLS
jgi:hypothetical protein